MPDLKLLNFLTKLIIMKPLIFVLLQCHLVHLRDKFVLEISKTEDHKQNISIKRPREKIIANYLDLAILKVDFY